MYIIKISEAINKSLVTLLARHSIILHVSETFSGTSQIIQCSNSDALLGSYNMLRWYNTKFVVNLHSTNPYRDHLVRVHKSPCINLIPYV